MFSPTEAEIIRQIKQGSKNINLVIDSVSATDPTAAYPTPNAQYAGISLGPDSDIDIAGISYTDFFGATVIERVSGKAPFIGTIRQPLPITDPSACPNIRYWRDASINTWFQSAVALSALPSLSLIYHTQPPAAQLFSKRTPKFYYGTFTFDAGTGTTYNIARIPTFGRNYISVYFVRTGGTITPTLNGVVFNNTGVGTVTSLTVNMSTGTSLISTTSTSGLVCTGITVGNLATSSLQVNRGWYCDALSLDCVKTTAGVQTINFAIEVRDHVELP